MPENSIQNQASYPQQKVVSISKNTEKREPVKYNKPRCVIPVDDMTWVLSQAKSIQSLWNECWISDPYGSRFVKLTTTLKESAFRLARKIIQATGLFQFKPDKSAHDSRKTEGWLVINLHGARRIKDFWNCEISATDSPISATDSPIAAKNSPIAATNSPISATNSRSICSETIANTGVLEPLSNSSLSSQELLKEVPEEEITQESELVEQVPTLAPTFVEEKTAEILESGFCSSTKDAERIATCMERGMKRAADEQPEQSFRELFIGRFGIYSSSVS